uniref:Uncharacterized protein n=1 Tax=Physcomitrium patens TaxID=3218 RepID=A0A2K1KFC3_PHYPA|nr:hypothetical protein PHYPA_008852 [Physcomitrium patens]
MGATERGLCCCCCCCCLLGWWKLSAPRVGQQLLRRRVWLLKMGAPLRHTHLARLQIELSLRDRLTPQPRLLNANTQKAAEEWKRGTTFGQGIRCLWCRGLQCPSAFLNSWGAKLFFPSFFVIRLELNMKELILLPAGDILRILPNGALGNWLILVFNLRLAASGE